MPRLALITPEEFAVMAKTVWGEARGEKEAGQEAVAHVILNRWTKTNKTLAEICLKPFAFSCWIASDPNASKIAALHFGGDRDFRDCAISCLRAISSNTDPTFGATHYFAPNPHLSPPNWAQGHTACAIIGRHLFFNDVR